MEISSERDCLAGPKVPRGLYLRACTGARKMDVLANSARPQVQIAGVARISALELVELSPLPGPLHTP